MSGIPSARSILESMRGYIKDPEQPPSSSERGVKLGTIDAAYTGVGSPKVLFDGEDTMGTRGYVSLGYVSANDRVVLLPVGHTYVILGAIGGGVGVPYRKANGRVTKVITAGAPDTQAITFPAGLFTVAPAITFGRDNNNSPDIAILSANVTTSGFDLIRNASGTGSRTVGVTWEATQMRPTSAVS